MNRRGRHPGGASRLQLWGRRRGSGPLGRAEAERLLTGQADDTDHRRLAALLAAATDPVAPQNAGAYRPARDAFVHAAARPDADAGRHSTRGLRAFPIARTATAKIVGVAALFSLTGVAAAAETGALPTPAQRVAHTWFGDLGVPPPAPANQKDDGAGRTWQGPQSSAPTGVAPSVGDIAGIPSPTSGASTSDTEATDPAVAALCRALTQAGDGGRGRALSATERKTLALAAGGEQQIAVYCARLASMPDTGLPTSTSGPAASTPTESARTHPTPSNDASHTPNGVGNSGSGPTHKPTPSRPTTPTRPLHGL